MISLDVRSSTMIAMGFVGYRVKTVIASCNADGCDATAWRLSETGARLFNPADLSSMEGIQFLAEESGKRENKLDIVVNDAGAIRVNANSQQDESTPS